jgi:uncharacterized integral membrane protein
MNTSDDVPPAEIEDVRPEEGVETPTVEVGTVDEAGTVEAVTAPLQRRVFVGTGLFWGLLVGVVVAVAFIILAAQNTESIEVRFMSWAGTMPVIALILISLLVGVVLDEVVGLVYRARRRRVLQAMEELRILRSRSSSE